MRTRQSDGIGRWLTAAMIAGAGLVSGAAQATLIDQLDGTVLDTETNLEWVQDAPNVLLTWQDAMDWAFDLGLDGGGWMGPTADQLITLYQHISAQTTCFSNGDCTGSRPPFALIYVDYWSSTEQSSFGALKVFFDGPATADLYDKTSTAHAWAVRSSAVVPSPGGMALLGIGALALGWSRRRKASNPARGRASPEALRNFGGSFGRSAG